MSRIWIDLDNAPHVPFFRPLIRAFESRGHSVAVTIRDYGYTAGLCERAGIDYRIIGRHPGGNPIRKVGSLAVRSLRLARWAKKSGVDIGLSHGSRGLVGGAFLARIPCVTMFDYEHVSSTLFRMLSSKLLLPEALESIISGDGVRYYAGYKEEVYLGEFEPDSESVASLPLPEDRTVVLIRPPATTAHYHDARSEALFQGVLGRISKAADLFGLIVPRTRAQGAEIGKTLENSLNFHILEHPVSGLNLIHQADLVVGGGGTMNREAALLGVPVYSIFTGPVGTIDQRLAEEGKLVLVRQADDVMAIKFVRRKRGDIEGQLDRLRARSQVLVTTIVDSILEFV